MLFHRTWIILYVKVQAHDDADIELDDDGGMPAEGESMAIVTISRQMGSKGDAVAEVLARELGYRVFDKKAIEDLLQKHGVDAEGLERYNEKRPGPFEFFSSEKDRYIHYLKMVVIEAALDDNCIIIGRGAQNILRCVPSAVHIKFIAPFKMRVKNVEERFGCDEKHANSIIKQSDHDRNGYQKYFFNVNWDSPDLYDAVLNTASFEPEMMVEVVKGLVATREKKVEAGTTLLNNMLQGQSVSGRILFEDAVPVRFLEVEIRGSTIVLRGVVDSPAHVKLCEDSARAAAPGVEIISEIAVVESFHTII